jgi:hypothetical protein
VLPPDRYLSAGWRYTTISLIKRKTTLSIAHPESWSIYILEKALEDVN